MGLFLTVAVVGLAYFLLKERRFDLFALAFFSGCVYFLPGFFGQTREGFAAFGAAKDLHPTTYAIFISVLLSILLASILWDAMSHRLRSPLRLSDASHMPAVFFVLALLGLVLTILSSGADLFYHKKDVVLESLTRWYLIWAFSAGLATLTAFMQKRRWLFIFSVAMILFDVYLGFRSLFAITFLALMTLHFHQQGRQRLLLNNGPWLLGVLMVGFFLFAYKYMYISIKLNDWGLIQSRLQDWTFMRTIFMGSEPFTVQTVLNEIVSQDYYIGTAHLQDLVYRLGIMMPTLGAEVVSFNSYFQPALFPDVKGGLANNIWGEMWAVGRWQAMGVFIMIFIFLLGVFNYLLSARCMALNALAASMGAYWAFYIHRNDIGFQIDLERRVLFIWILAWVISALLCNVMRRRQRALKREVGA